MDDELGPGGATGDVDELEHGVERRSVPRPVRVVAAVVGCAVATLLVWHSLRPAGDHPVATPTPSVAPPLSFALEARSVCTSFADPILQVGLQLTNISRQPVDIRSVSTGLPIPMLLTLGVDLTSEPCQSRSNRQGGAAVPAKGSLAPGASLPVTFRLLPVVECAAPAPVQAEVTVARGDATEVVTVPVLVDLGSVRFPGCPALTG